MGVSISPGQSTLTRILCAAYSQGRRFRQANDAMFGGDIGPHAWETDQASYRGDVDNRTSTMLLHLEDLRFHAEPDTP